MLISKVSEDGDKADQSAPVDDDTHEYQTANELFELMAKNQNFNNDGGTLTPRELVLLYKNIDLGTKLMSNANEMKRGHSNQRVENIVHNDEHESDSSELSEIYSTEDLQSVILINKEQIDFLNGKPSFENTLCHKVGDLELPSSVNTDYDKHFLFHDPFIKDQLKSVNLLSVNKDVDCTSILPPSLLDYICCKRLEDNYNFYMDNIIRYVKNTIEQLKRISNGDYLTAKAKEKWKEVENVEDTNHNNTKVLATSTSIPLHVECKIDGLKSTWDDLVHSAVDVRSLSKILEKKIIVEIPKFINGSYTLLSKCCNDNLIISCKKENQPSDESRVDVVLQLKRSDTGHVISKISSIMVLQTTPAVIQGPNTPLPITYKTHNDDSQNDDVKVEELNITTTTTTPTTTTTTAVRDNNVEEDNEVEEEEIYIDVTSDYYDIDNSESCQPPFFDSSQDGVTESRSSIGMSCSQEEVKGQEPLKEAIGDLFQADIRMTIKSALIQSSLPEECTDDSQSSKKKTMRVRIKSPYENQSYVIEEKKRRKLLEIREKRERKKRALMDSCKINKHKYDNARTTPQAAASVTKLSITNKSFYNSIYGHSSSVGDKQASNRNRKRDSSKDTDATVEDSESEDTSGTPSERAADSQKFINRNYYLDDTITEMMYMNMKQQEREKDLMSHSTSGASCDLGNNLSLLSQLMTPFTPVLNEMTDTTDDLPQSDITPDNLIIGPYKEDENGQIINNKGKTESHTKLNTVPSNTPKGFNKTDAIKKMASSVECRKSIDKIYQLIKTDKNQYTGSKSQNMFSSNNKDNITKDSSAHDSESATSLKHQTSSSPSSFSIDKQAKRETSQKRSRSPGTVIPKVIISSRSQIPSNESERTKKERKVSSASSKSRDKSNPLKAISQLLHEFENVQRNRVKTKPEQKPVKKVDNGTTADARIGSSQGLAKRRSRLEEHNDNMHKYAKGHVSRAVATGMDVVKVPFQQIPVDAQLANKGGKKKINDILDEAKEARGEAVKGPSKFTSRLNSLAQPKKSYVQAHSEEYQTRYGRNLITDRLQRLAAITPAPPISEKPARVINTNRNIKPKRNTNEPVNPVRSGVPIERGVRPRYSNSSSPERGKPVNYPLGNAVIGPSYKNVNVPEPPKVLKKKMAAVESYVNSHYGRTLSPPVATDKPHIQKLRAPVLPKDIDTSDSNPSGPQESTEVGSKLHRIIESMIMNTSYGLDVLTECLETTSKSSQDNTTDFSTNVNCSQGDKMVPKDSNFDSDGKDNRIALVDNVDGEKQEDSTDDEIDFEFLEQTNKSATDLSYKGQLSFDQQLSVGTFAKPMRINNLSLTPKSSIQQLLVLQSGDSGSVMVQTRIPNKIMPERVTRLKSLHLLTKTHWDFPVYSNQISTVAYSLPEYEINRRPNSVSVSLTKLFQEVSEVSFNCATVNHGMASNCAAQDKLMNTSPPIKPELPIIQCGNNKQQPPIRFEQYIQMSSSGTPPMATIPRELGCCNNAPTEISHLDNEPPAVAKEVTTSDNEEIKQTTKKETGTITNTESETLTRQECDPLAKKETETKLTQTIILPDKNNSESGSKMSDVDYTTSLDILVGLLNEIKKITTCQTHITNNENDDSNELEMILNKAGMLNSPKSSYNISISSLDKLRCLESNQSIYSFYLSDGEFLQDRNDKEQNTTGIDSLRKPIADIFSSKPLCEDKGVNVDIATSQCVDRLTDVPSIFFPVALNRSTNLTSSLMLEDICQSSTQSFFSFSDFTYSNDLSSTSLYSDAYSNKIIELLPQIVKIDDIDQPVEQVQVIGNVNTTKPVEQKIESCNNYAMTKKKTLRRPKEEYCLEKVKFDPLIKLKRDILVTVYSMLVLTVFAALSFPEMLYHVV